MGGSGPAVTPSVCKVPQGTSADAQALAASQTAFALAFYPPAVDAAGAGNNVIVSPYTVSAVLTMLDVGAAGETATQMQSVLGLPGGAAAEAPAYAALACGDESDGSSFENHLAVAGALWVQQGLSLEQSFASVLADGYAAPLQSVDFAGDPGAATSTIDQWVSKATDGQIPTLFQPGDLGTTTRLVLVSALYFKGVWANGFDPSATSMQPFTLSDGTVVDVPTMSGTVFAAQAYGDGFTLVELPYRGDALAMDILQPATSLADLVAGLTPEALASAVANAAGLGPGPVQMPKFSYQTRLDLGSLLSGMGMPDAFDPATADFSGIDGAEDLYVDTVVHTATVEVDEQGTVAAAATGSDQCVEISGPSPVVIDQPFLFLIRDIRSGSVLFMGSVEDPRQGSP